MLQKYIPEIKFVKERHSKIIDHMIIFKPLITYKLISFTILCFKLQCLISFQVEISFLSTIFTFP